MLFACCWFCSFSCNHLWPRACLSSQPRCFAYFWICVTVCFGSVLYLSSCLCWRFWKKGWMSCWTSVLGGVSTGLCAGAMSWARFPVSQIRWAGSWHLPAHTNADAYMHRGREVARRRPSCVRLMMWSCEGLKAPRFLLLFVMLWNALSGKQAIGITHSALTAKQ